MTQNPLVTAWSKRVTSGGIDFWQFHDGISPNKTRFSRILLYEASCVRQAEHRPGELALVTQVH